MENITLDNVSVSTEELLGPPKVDGVGFSLMVLIGIVTGFLVGIIVFLLAYLVMGDFSLSSGASPILLAMITFFATLLGNFLYVWWLGSVFPHIYSGAKSILVQVSVFSIVLYICMSWVYLIVDILPLEPQAILAVYVAHVIFDIFGLVLITGILSMYRYSILVFYASIIALLISGMIPVMAFTNMATSSNTLFIFMVFSALVFGITTFVTFWLLSLYYRIYTTSGYDPLGDVFHRIMEEEKLQEANAEKTLFQ